MEFDLKFAIFHIEHETRGNSFRLSRVIPGYGLQKDIKFAELSQIKNVFQVGVAGVFPRCVVREQEYIL